MVSVYEDSELVFEALKSGASGYITKSANYQELLAALEEIVRGRTHEQQDCQDGDR